MGNKYDRAATKGGPSLLAAFKGNIRQYTMIIALVAILGIFAVLTEGVNLSSRNLTNLLQQMATVGIATCGMVMIMVAAHIDLAAGSIIGFTGAVAAVLLVNMNMNVWLAILLTLGVGLLIGAWQGVWVAYAGVPAFIVTLAGQLIFRGAVIGVTNSTSIAPNNPIFKQIGQGFFMEDFRIAGMNIPALIIGILCVAAYIIMTLRKRNSRKKHGYDVESTSLFLTKLIGISALIAFLFYYVLIINRGISYAVIILAVIVGVFTIVTQKTPFGRHIYAIGGNREAARLSGINIKKTNFVIFVLAGLVTAISGIVYTSRLNAAAISGGTGMELDIIAACIIGGTSTLGGEGTVPGCIIGAMVMATIDNGMSLMGMGSFEQYVVKGLVLLLAVWVDIATRKNKNS